MAAEADGEAARLQRRVWPSLDQPPLLEIAAPASEPRIAAAARTMDPGDSVGLTAYFFVRIGSGMSLAGMVPTSSSTSLSLASFLMRQ